MHSRSRQQQQQQLSTPLSGGAGGGGRLRQLRSHLLQRTVWFVLFIVGTTICSFLLRGGGGSTTIGSGNKESLLIDLPPLSSSSSSLHDGVAEDNEITTRTTNSLEKRNKKKKDKHARITKNVAAEEESVEDSLDSTVKKNKNKNTDFKQQEQPTQEEHKYEQGEKKTITITEAGVDVSDPALWEGVDLQGDSSTATVMGMATNYGLSTYQQFVGSLRNSGFKGHIILGVSPDVSQKILDYFAHRNVTYKKLSYVDCTYLDTASRNERSATKNSHEKERLTCVHPYPDIKIRWSRFPLIRDWLQDCTSCTGPVLIMDVRDSLFQRDPFGPGSPVVKGLQVFEEHKTQRTLHWLAATPFRVCKKTIMNETMLCSGTTIGTRVAMIKYLEAMYVEMKVWIQSPKCCCFEMNGDDQSIHNWLFYTNQLPFATPFENRMGGIVHTAGVQGANLARAHKKHFSEPPYNLPPGDAMWKPFQGADEVLELSNKEVDKKVNARWIGKEFDICNDEGRFTEFDGTVSRVVHQFDRFGRPLVNLWLPYQTFLKDPFPPPPRSSTTE